MDTATKYLLKPSIREGHLAWLIYGKPPKDRPPKADSEPEGYRLHVELKEIMAAFYKLPAINQYQDIPCADLRSAIETTDRPVDPAITVFCEKWEHVLRTGKPFPAPAAGEPCDVGEHSTVVAAELRSSDEIADRKKRDSRTRPNVRLAANEILNKGFENGPDARDQLTEKLQSKFPKLSFGTLERYTRDIFKDWKNRQEQEKRGQLNPE